MSSSHVLSPPVSLRCPPRVIAAFTVGTLDLVSCSFFWFLRDVPPTRVIQSLGSWVIGADAYKTAGTGVALGLVVLYTAAALWVWGYQAASQRWPAMLQAPLCSGAVYGALLFALMHWIVVPLSAAPVLHTRSDWLIALLSIHVVLIGIPCALFARWMRRLTPMPSRHNMKT